MCACDVRSPRDSDKAIYFIFTFILFVFVTKNRSNLSSSTVFVHFTRFSTSHSPIKSFLFSFDCRLSTLRYVSRGQVSARIHYDERHRLKVARKKKLDHKKMKFLAFPSSSSSETHQIGEFGVFVVLSSVISLAPFYSAAHVGYYLFYQVIS